MFQRKLIIALPLVVLAIFWLGTAVPAPQQAGAGSPPAQETKPGDEKKPPEDKKEPPKKEEAPDRGTLRDFYNRRTNPFVNKPDPDTKQVLPQVPDANFGGAVPPAPGGVTPKTLPLPTPTTGGPIPKTVATPAQAIPPGPTPARPMPPPSAPPRRLAAAVPALAGEGEKMHVKFNEMAIVDFIRQMATLLNIEYILHRSVGSGSGQVSIDANIQKDDLFAVFETVLRQNEIGIVRDARISNLYYIQPIIEVIKEPNTRVVPRYPADGNGAGLREMPVKTDGTMPAGLPSGAAGGAAKEGKDVLDKRSEFATYVIPVEFMSSTEMSQIVQHLKMLSGAGQAIDFSTSNLLIVTDFKNNVDRLVEVMRALDGRMFEEGNLDLIKMRYSSVLEIHDDLKKIFTQGRGDAKIGITFVPLERLNALLVVANSPRALEEVHRWVDRLDSPQGRASKTHIYHVQNSIAGNIASILSQIYAEGPGGPAGARPGSPYAPPGTPTRPGAFSGTGAGYTGTGAPGTSGLGSPVGGSGQFYGSGFSGGASSTYGTGFGSSYGMGGGYGGGGFGGGGLGGGIGYPGSPGYGQGSMLGTRTRGTVAPGGVRTELGGRDGSIRIIVDDYNNTLIIQSSDADYENLLETIRQLDVLPRQVLIDVKVISVGISDSFSFGINTELARRGGLARDPVTGAFIPQPPGVLGEAPQFQREPSRRVTEYFGGSAGTTAGITPSDKDGKALASFIRSFAFVGDESIILGQLVASRSRGQTKLLQSPTLLALDGQQSRLHVGQQVTFNSGGFIPTGGGVTGVSQNQLLPVGTTMDVVPRINASGIVTLEIGVSITSSADPGAGAAGPSFNDTSLNTTLTVRDGETVVLGGIITENKSVSRTRIPLLGDIPLLGALFGTTNRNTSRSELIILITPRVVRDIESHVAATEDVRYRYKHADQALSELDDQLKKTVRQAQERRRKEEQKRPKKEFDPQERPEAPTRDPR